MTNFMSMNRLAIGLCMLAIGFSSAVQAVQSPCGGPALNPVPSITFTWDPVPNAQSYDVEVTLNPAFTYGVQRVSSPSSTTTAQMTGLQSSATYYWRSRTNIAQSWQQPNYVFGTICTFTTTGTPTQVPPVVVEWSPAQNSSVPWVGTMDTLFWNAVAGATQYEVQVSTSATFSSGVVSVSTSLLKWKPNNLAINPGTTYYWRVRARNVIGWGPWPAAAWRFDTQSLATQVTFKAFLQGPLVTTVATSMTDNLRSLGLLTRDQPYFRLITNNPQLPFGYWVPNYPSITFEPSNLSDWTSQATLDATGPQAVVDWVVVEARHGTTNLPMRSWVMLLRKDGSMVLPGGGTVNEQLPMKNMKFAIRHRNHLGAMTLNAVNAVGTSLTIDFTSTSTAMHGTDATYINALGKRALWAGDCNSNGTILYTGSDNDRDQVLSEIGGVVPTNTVTGYKITDLNMDGTVKYTGSGNDRDIILSVIGGVVPTNSRVQQLP